MPGVFLVIIMCCNCDDAKLTVCKASFGTILIRFLLNLFKVNAQTDQHSLLYKRENICLMAI